VHTAFRGAWWAIAGASLLGAVTALGMTPPDPSRSAPDPGPDAAGRD
jgi:hypothetical protein